MAGSLFQSPPAASHKEDPMAGSLFQSPPAASQQEYPMARSLSQRPPAASETHLEEGTSTRLDEYAGSGVPHPRPRVVEGRAAPAQPMKVSSPGEMSLLEAGCAPLSPDGAEEGLLISRHSFSIADVRLQSEEQTDECFFRPLQGLEAEVDEGGIGTLYGPDGEAINFDASMAHTIEDDESEELDVDTSARVESGLDLEEESGGSMTDSEGLVATDAAWLEQYVDRAMALYLAKLSRHQSGWDELQLGSALSQTALVDSVPAAGAVYYECGA
jgi:hypothetical protein